MCYSGGMRKVSVRFPEDEHDAVVLLANLIGCSQNTLHRALAAEAARRFEREPHTVKALIEGFRLGSPEADR